MRFKLNCRAAARAVTVLGTDLAAPALNVFSVATASKLAERSTSELLRSMQTRAGIYEPASMNRVEAMLT
jgi:hypothetical protein